MNKIYTIGYSNNDIIYFLDLLKQLNINCLIDVRSVPYSKYCKQYNKDSIKRILKSKNISYMHMGKEFGARREESNLYSEEGYVDFQKVKKDNDFLLGVERIKAGLEKGYNIALMCSEKDPKECHRGILIGKHFKDIGYEVIHIIDGKNLKSQEDIEEELIKEYYSNGCQMSLIQEENIPLIEENELIEEIYRLKNKEIGYKRKVK